MLERLSQAPCPSCGRVSSPADRVREDAESTATEDAFSVVRVREWLRCAGCGALLAAERTDLAVNSLLGRDRISTWEQPRVVATGAFLKRLLERLQAGEPVPEGLEVVRSIPEFARVLGLPAPGPLPPPKSDLESLVGMVLGVATGIMFAAAVRRR